MKGCVKLSPVWNIRVVASIVSISLALFQTCTPAAQAQSVRYQDEAGNIFFVDSINEVPERYRWQVVPPTTLPRMSAKEWKQYQRELHKRQQMEARARQIEERRKAKEQKLAGVSKEGEPRTPMANKQKQRVTITLFVGPSCADCIRLEKVLNEHRIKFQKLDISKSAAAFTQFDRLGVGSTLPVTKIGTQVIKGFQPNTVLHAAGALGASAPQKQRAAEEEL